MQKPLRSAMIGAGIIGALVAGGATASFAQSAFQSGSDTTTQPATSAPSGETGSAPQGQGQQGQRPQFDPSKGGHQANGITETLLTGETATKVTEAAQAAVPGATVERVETDAEGAAYEAHVVTSDGTHKTVKFNADYTVAGIEEDQMGPPDGAKGANGANGGAANGGLAGPGGMGHGGRGQGAPNGQAPGYGGQGQQSAPSTQQGS